MIMAIRGDSIDHGAAGSSSLLLYFCLLRRCQTINCIRGPLPHCGGFDRAGGQTCPVHFVSLIGKPGKVLNKILQRGLGGGAATEGGFR